MIGLLFVLMGVLYILHLKELSREKLIKVRFFINELDEDHFSENY